MSADEHWRVSGDETCLDKKLISNARNMFEFMKERKGEDVNRTYGESPEYGDLELFLEVCREMNIEADLIILPVNGYWYDYTGFQRKTEILL